MVRPQEKVAAVNLFDPPPEVVAAREHNADFEDNRASYLRLDAVASLDGGQRSASSASRGSSRY